MMRTSELAARVRAIEERIAALDGRAMDIETASQEASAAPEQSVKHAYLTAVLQIMHWCTGKRRA